MNNKDVRERKHVFLDINHRTGEIKLFVSDKSDWEKEWRKENNVIKGEGALCWGMKKIRRYSKYWEYKGKKTTSCGVEHERPLVPMLLSKEVIGDDEVLLKKLGFLK